MKCNPILTIVAIALSALIAYAFGTITKSEYYILLSVGSFIMLACSNIALLGVSFAKQGTAVNAKIVAGIFSVVFFLSNLIIAFFNFTIAPYVIINGVLFLIFVIAIYSVYKAKM